MILVNKTPNGRLTLDYPTDVIAAPPQILLTVPYSTSKYY